jgi:hypothetical protein
MIGDLALLVRNLRPAAAILAAVAIAAVSLPIAAQTTQTPDFDHFPTGYPLTGAHKATKCELCHVKAIFKGTSKICEGCHAPNTNVSAIVTPTTHPPTTQRCDLCHTTVTFTGARWNHIDAQPGACASCHNGQIAPGKPANHVPTTQSCDVCHRTVAWRPAAFDHTGIASGCARCHDGVAALGKPAAHIPTSQPCETCHLSTTSFATWSMNHAQIVNGCASCHGGQFAGVVAKPATHVPTAAPCESCHSSFTSFKGALFSHAGIAGQCATCHNGSAALGMPGNHVPTSQPCEICHSTSNFTSFAGTQMNHAGISAGCSACHAAGSSFFGVAVKTPPGNHIPTTQPCEVCHSASNFASFAGGQMNHAGITSGCASCHAAGSSFFGVTVKTPPANHIPTAGAACEGCHSPGAFTSFAGTPMNHGPVAGISCSTCHETGRSWFGVTIVTRPTLAQDPNHPQTGDCGQCHTTATFNNIGKPANHIPTLQPCTLCHSSANDYSTATMNHAGIASGCATCHGPGLSFANIVPKEPPPTHIPTSQPCEVCHAASNFNTFTGTPMNHAGITSGCATCHAAGSGFFGVAIKTPPANHIPTGGAACEACHAVSNFNTFAGTAMNHAPVSAMPCTNCHETGKSFFGVTIVTRPTLAQDPNHPQAGDCGQCHTTATFNNAGKPANHIPTNQPCALCHSNPSDYSQATMNHAGITSGCATCHGPGLSFANIVPKAPPPTHIPTNQPCEVCHSASTFNTFAGTQMNHAGITSGCATCHAAGSSFFGVAIKTPPANHIPTGGAACEACHSPNTFTSFAGTPMNHAPVGAMTCITCHETGKSFFGVTIVTRPTPAQDPNHPQTGDCGQCHTTATFNNLGKPANHIPTNQACALCHSNPSDYSQATMNHAGIASGCATCHGPGLSFANIVPKAPPPTHIPTSQPCEVCHSASNFNTFAGTQMNHAGITSGCATCHAAGSSFFGVAIKTPPANHIPIGGAACEACHAVSNFNTFAGTAMNHAPVSAITCATCHEAGKSWFGVTIVTRPTPAQDPSHPQTGDCGQCHTTSTFNGNTKPANHIPTNQPCALCHSNPSDYSTATMNHAGITSGCATCHGPGLSFANIVPKAPPATHIPTSQPCEVCHSASNFNSFAGTQMNHAGITNNCANCHAAGKSFFGVTIKTPPATHIPFGSAACEACHSPNTFTSFAGTPMNHAAVSALTCATCHETGKSWFGVNIVTRPTPAQDPSHPQTGDCGQCHTTSTFNGNSKPANHIPTNQPCALCHNNPNDYSQAAMNHTGITSGCATCHGPGLSFANIVPKEPPGTHIPYGAATCEACHSPAKFSSFSGTAMNHGAVAGMKCVSCHELGMSWFGVNIVTRPSASHHPGQDCGQCHNTTSFDDAAAARLRRAGTTATAAAPPAGGPRIPATGRLGAAAHIGIAVGSCASCHNGTTATAKSGRHLATVLSCDACHRTTTWRPASFTHLGIAPGGCLACHNGNMAKAKAASHFATARSCDACHSASTWMVVRYQHLSPAYRQHGASVSCKSCHKSNAETVVWQGPAFKPDCAGCHANQFRPEAHPKPTGGLHTVLELRDCSGSCHVGGAPGKGSARLLSARHRPTDGSF